MNPETLTADFNMYEIIAKKRDGHKLSTAEIQFFVQGVAGGNIPDYQAAALLMAIYIRGIDPRELADLTQFMKRSGDTISLDSIQGKKIDKHSTGGVGDKISFIVAPLVAACGVYVPMLSGRSLGHTGGTLDKLESIPGFNVFLNPQQFMQILGEVGMVICGQTENIVPADRKLYALRDSTATVTHIPLISASIMSKKLALGTDGIILDIKTGSGAFMKRLEDSIQLARTMVDIGEKAGRTTIGLITNMDQPLGLAVGNSLEIIESIETLKGNGPQDVLDVTFALGAAMLIAAGKAPDFPSALAILKPTLQSGKPLQIFKHFIAAQQGNPHICDQYQLLPTASHQIPLIANTPGYISAINAYEIGMTAIDIGAGRRTKEDPIDPSAGLIFHKKVGDPISPGDTILTIHSNQPQKIDAAKQRLYNAITLTNTPPPPTPSILYIVDKAGMVPWNPNQFPI